MDTIEAATTPDDCGLPCPVDATLRVLSGRWKAMLLYQLRDGPKHFAALRRRVPEATQRMTTLHLRALERDGLIRRTVIPGDAAGRVARVDYALTDKGRSLSPVLEAMAAWGGRWAAGGTAKEAGGDVADASGRPGPPRRPSTSAPSAGPTPGR